MAWAFLEDCVAAFHPLAPAAWSVAAGSVAVLGLAGLAVLSMRRTSAAARHAVWLMAFVALLLLPVLSATLPGWHVLPPGRGASAPAPQPPEVVTAPPAPSSGRPSALAPVPAREGDEAAIAANTKQELSGAHSPAPSPARPPQARSPASIVAAQSAGPAARPEKSPWTAWLLPCWALGTLLLSGRVLLANVSLRWLHGHSTRVARGELFDLLERLRAQLRLRRAVELRSSAERTMPMTWGLWRARLLVPEHAAVWPPDQQRDVLLHELGHVKRWDCLAQLLSQLACALYWFNPLAWVGLRRMQVERERACDDVVLNSGAEASAYARHLLASVTAMPPIRLAGAAVAMARQSTLEERMRAILDGGLNRRALTARGALTIVFLLSLALAPAAVLRAQQSPAQDAPPTGGGPVGGPANPANPANPADSSPTTRRTAATRPTTRPGVPGPRFGGRGFPGSGGAPTLGEGPTCTLDATIYDVRIPVDQIGKLDVEALAKAAETADGFEKALAALGTARPMYRANQSVRLSGDTITIGSEVPIVTNSRVTDKGQTINTVQYQSTGALFTIAGKAGAPGGGGGDVDLSIQVSSSSDVGAPISDKVKAPVMRRATLAHKGPFQARQPFVVLSVDAGSADKDGRAVAYIGRITMGEPQPPAPK